MASKEKANIWMRNAIRGTFSAALAVGPMAHAESAHAQTAASAPEVIHVDTLGVHAFAQSMTEALDDAHLERVFATSVQEGQLVAADHDAFMAAGRAQRASIGEVRLVQPREQFPWMTDRLDPATGAGPSVVEWDGQIPFRARTFSVTRANGTVQWYGIVEATMDGRPCYNYVPLPAPEVMPTPVQRVESPCPDHTRVSVEGLPQDADVTMVLAVDLSAGRNLHTVDGQMCPSVSLAETCGECTSHVAVATVTEIAEALHKRYGLLSAQTYQAHGGTLNMEIPPTITLTVGGREVTIDVNQAIRDGIISVALSCPRNEHGRGQGQTGLIETSDWAQSRDGRDGESTLSMRFANGVYRVNSQR